MAHKIGHTRKKPNGKTEKWTGKRWVEQTQPLKTVRNLINKTKLFVKNKSNPNKSTGKGNQHLNFNKPEGKKDHNKQFASFREDASDQAKLNKQVKEGKKVTYQRVTKKNKDKLSNQHKVKSKSSNTTNKFRRTKGEGIEGKSKGYRGDTRITKSLKKSGFTESRLARLRKQHAEFKAKRKKKK